MNRKSFDRIASVIGLLLAAFLFVAGGLMQWGYTFTNNTVKSQLSEQAITMPSTTHNAKEASDVTAFFAANGNKMMTNGKQAEMYADHYIAFHLSSMPTYAAASGASRAAAAAAAAKPADAALAQAAATAAQVTDTVFKGQSLRGMLLNAYAFWQIGQIALYGAIAAYLGGIIFLILAIMGFAHLRRTSEDAAI